MRSQGLQPDQTCVAVVHHQAHPSVCFLHGLGAVAARMQAASGGCRSGPADEPVPYASRQRMRSRSPRRSPPRRSRYSKRLLAPPPSPPRSGISVAVGPGMTFDHVKQACNSAHCLLGPSTTCIVCMHTRVQCEAVTHSISETSAKVRNFTTIRALYKMFRFHGKHSVSHIVPVKCTHIVPVKCTQAAAAAAAAARGGGAGATPAPRHGAPRAAPPPPVAAPRAAPPPPVAAPPAAPPPRLATAPPAGGPAGLLP